MARTLVVGTAGHIDHGKSALVRALTGIEPDRLKEEQERGITIELGFAHVTLRDVDIAFVDVPGHERFVRTMLAGAGGVDAVLLVVAANESVMPQTREHFEICRLLAIPRGIIVITKSDAADADTVALAELETRELVAGSALADAPVVVVSALTGDGLDRLRDALVALAAEAPLHDGRGLARLPIDRAFSVHGFGTVVTGTLVSGQVRVGDSVELLPDRVEVRVRGVQVHGKAADAAAAPRRVALNLGGIDLERVSRGMTLAAAGSLPVTRRVDVQIELLPGARPLRHGARVRVHQGTSEVVGHVSLSSIRARSATGSNVWTRVDVGANDVAVPPGGAALARLRLAQPAVLTRGDRIVLRAVSPAATIGGAVVLDPEPPAGGIRRRRAADRLEAMTTTDAVAWSAAVIAEAGIRGLTSHDLARRGGLRPEEAGSVLRDLAARGTVIGDFGAVARSAKGARETWIDAQVAATAQRARLASAAPRPVVTEDDARVMAEVERALQAAGVQPPDVATLATAAGASVAIVQKALHGLVKAGRVQRLDVLWFHADTLVALKAQVKALGPGATIDVASAKAKFGVSRKFAIPLLEYLDRERITRRVGDRRVVI